MILFPILRNIKLTKRKETDIIIKNNDEESDNNMELVIEDNNLIDKLIEENLNINEIIKEKS